MSDTSHRPNVPQPQKRRLHPMLVVLIVVLSILAPPVGGYLILLAVAMFTTGQPN